MTNSRLISLHGFMQHLGGTGLAVDERLFRVFSHGPSVIDLFKGQLDVTRTGKFLSKTGNDARDDSFEAAETLGAVDLS